jgi:hypothetical protein
MTETTTAPVRERPTDEAAQHRARPSDKAAQLPERPGR